MSSIDYHYSPDDTPMSEKFTGKQEEPMKYEPYSVRQAERRRLQEGDYSEPDSAAVDAVAKAIYDSDYEPKLSMFTCQNLARAVLAHLREHPEFLGIPVMTVEQAANNWINSGCGTTALWLETIAGTIITPDPDPPAAEPVPSVDTVMALIMSYAFTPDRGESGEELRAVITRLVEVAKGGGAK